MISQMLKERQYHRLPQNFYDDRTFDVSYKSDFIFPHYEISALGSNQNLSGWALPLWYKHQTHSRHFRGHGRCFIAYNQKRSCTHMVFLFSILVYLLVIVLAMTAICSPSYSNPPAHYSFLARDCKDTDRPGCANPYQEKIFIAASILDKNGKLIKGSWGAAVSELVDLIGPENVFLSIYMNDADATTKPEIDYFESTLRCKFQNRNGADYLLLLTHIKGNSSIVNEHFDFNSLPSVRLLNGESRIKRIAYLAEIRNKALLPLDDGSLHSYTRFDKLLYLNDVAFNPVDAAQLLFSTNLAENGRTDYLSACAVDFVNAFKFYDTFATRDLQGNGIGLPFFPWFSNKDNGYSRADVLNQKDAVRVRSCWGGMVAFEAKWFQMDDGPKETTLNMNRTNLEDSEETSNKLAISKLGSQMPLRFRYETELYWESSECCLIQADLQSRAGSVDSLNTGIYVNPFVRVAYDEQTLSWLPFTRRFEKLYSFVHHLLNVIIGLPRERKRYKGDIFTKTREPIQTFDQSTNETGRERDHHVLHVGRADSFCGSQMLLVLMDFPPVDGSRWYKVPAP